VSHTHPKNRATHQTLDKIGYILITKSQKTYYMVVLEFTNIILKIILVTTTIHAVMEENDWIQRHDIEISRT
jgi:hypothetical protein